MKHLTVIITLAVLMMGGSAFAQAPIQPELGTINRTFTLNSTTQSSPIIELNGTGVNMHKFTWNTVGTVSAGACRLESSTVRTPWANTTLIAAQTVTSTGGPTSITGPANVNFIMFDCTTPIVGTGTVYITYTGYIDAPATGGSVIITADVNVTQIGGASITLGQKDMDHSIPVVVAYDQTPVGQALMEASAPVVIASDQSAIPVTIDDPVEVFGTVTANAGTNLNTSALNLEATQQLVLAAIEDISLGMVTVVVKGGNPNGNNPGSTAINTTNCIAANNPPTLTAGNVYYLPCDDTGYVRVGMDSGFVASGAFASGALSSGSIASGALASGALASGAVSSGAIASGAFASGAVGSGAIASGALASGAVSSGAIASGAIASGAIASGAIASGAFAAGSLNSAIPDPCFYTAQSKATISISSAATTTIIENSASNKTYICGFSFTVSAADNVALVEDSDNACASPSAGLYGGTTSGTGWNFAANESTNLGFAGRTVFQTSSTNMDVCLITSSTAQLSGTVSYVQVP